MDYRQHVEDCLRCRRGAVAKWIELTLGAARRLGNGPGALSS